MNSIELYLNKQQFKKYLAGKAFQLTKSQIESDKGENKISIELTKKDFKKLASNLKKNKGYRFKINKEALDEVLETKKDEMIEGQGIKKKRFLKGSQEAKQFMMELRNRRKRKGGELSVEPVEPVEPIVEGGDLKSIIKATKRVYNKKVKPVLKSVSKQGKKILENVVVGGIDVLSENPVIGELGRPLIKQGINKISKTILGVGVKHDKHPCHQFLYSNLVGGVPYSHNEIRNVKKVGGSFKAL